MNLVRRRDLPLTHGQFRVRVFAATFALMFLLTMIIAAAYG